MLQLIIDALLPIVVTLILGVVAGRHGDTDPTTAAAMNRMVMTYALPLNLFAGTITTSRAALLGNLPMAGLLFVGMVVPYAFALCCAWKLFRRDLGSSTMQALAVAFPAVPFIGLPVLGTLFGASSTIIVAVSGLITNVLLVPASIVLLSAATGTSSGDARGGTERTSGIPAILRQTALEPVVWAPISAVILVLCGVQAPAALVNALQLLGHATAGVSLFASGVILQAQKPTVSGPVIASVASRLILVPGIALLLFPSAGLHGKQLGEAVVTLGMPAASILVILSVRFGAATRESASVLLFTNILAVPTLAALIVLSS